MKHISLLLLILASPFAYSAEWAEGLPTDTTFPNIEATDQFGKTWTLEQLLGENGMLFLFNRSTGW
ncbi:MAG: hypothetical protein HUJ31_15355 [Pseudomonadales bacterium]|nr:hypothetical protein [Pseudomonadales bacterium]